ncbi:extracellular solute-binding protein [Paenibacillus antri]|uniref:Extracellular solute-binding protein n=1 Tax=Paenibacillus antri TaxID=2582848 RepID=A0A5R9G9Y0_9BACL|nr:extracellular solute-binding protein [Paenibacillus antri]TLS48235.1 extracellular solute-binding protein [Paenibacillus antri]
MKKSLVIILLFALVATIAACSSGNSGSTSPSPSATPTEGPKEPVTIKFYTYKAERDEEPWVEAVKAFNELHPDIKVEYVSLVQNNDSVEFMNKLDVLMAGGEVVDIFHAANIEQLIERAARGVVEPLDPFFDAEGVEPNEEYVQVPAYDGKTYGIITTMTQWFVAFNRDHLEEANLPLPEMGWTWDDFRDYAKKLTVNDRYGTYFHTWGEFPNMIAYNELPHPQLNVDLTLNFDHPSFKTFFELRRAMEKEDKSVEPYADILASNYHPLQQFFAGNASMIPTGSFAVRAGTLLDRFPHDFQMVYAPMPRSSTEVEPGATNVSGSFLGMGTRSANKDAAYTFMRWVTTEGANYLKDFTGWKKADGKQLLTTFFGEHEALIDLESLSRVMYHPQTRSESAGIAVPYGTELKTVVENGFTKYMLDNTTFEEALESMKAEGEKAINK